MNSFSTKLHDDDPLRIDSSMISSHVDASLDGDVAMWDDHKMLTADEITTPTGVEPFFDTEHHVVFPTPSPIKRASHWNQAALQRFHEATSRYQQRQEQPQLEPSNEPCTEEIPWPDLVYWLGNTTTGQLECACSTCQFERSQGRVPTASPHHHHHHHHQQLVAQSQYTPSATYKRLSAKIPVIAVPRIEGVN